VSDCQVPSCRHRTWNATPPLRRLRSTIVAIKDPARTRETCPHVEHQPGRNRPRAFPQCSPMILHEEAPDLLVQVRGRAGARGGS
jgi:hypothetical protein